MNKIELIKKLSDANGAPGFEGDVCEVVRQAVDGTFQTFEDNIRNIFVYGDEVVDGTRKEGTIRIGLDSHSDECAYMVSAVMKSGLLKFIPLGTMLPYTAVAQSVRVRTTDGTYVPGIITSTPVHFLKDADWHKVVEWDDLYIDVGATSEKEARELFKIDEAAPVVPDVTCRYLEESQIFMGKAFDNRIGTAVLVEVMKKLKGQTKLEVVGAVSSQEEVGGRGARVSVNRVRPDFAIVFEGTPADDSFAGENQAQSCLKQGPQIRHIDKCMITHPGFVSLAREVAKKHNIPLQLAVRSGGGTNGQFYHYAFLGIPTIVIGVPVRYAHSHNCIISMEDFDNSVNLAVELIKEIEKRGIDPASF